MIAFRKAAFAAALLCASSAAFAGSLPASDGTQNYGRQGMYFDLTATNDLTITNFNVNGIQGDWTVYYKDGTYAGSELDMGAWTLLGSGTVGGDNLLNVGGLTIHAGQTKALYIFDFSGYQYYNNGFETHSNADLTFAGGTGNYGFFDNTLADRVWSGTINYNLNASPAPEPASWALMLGGFGAIGGAMRARRKASVTFA
jgi:hypothetical protein